VEKNTLLTLFFLFFLSFDTPRAGRARRTAPSLIFFFYVFFLSLFGTPALIDARGPARNLLLFPPDSPPFEMVKQPPSIRLSSFFFSLSDFRGDSGRDSCLLLSPPLFFLPSLSSVPVVKQVGRPPLFFPF